MKIVLYACVQTEPKGLFKRARIEVFVGPQNFPTEFFVEASSTFLQGHVPHDSCSHEVTLHTVDPRFIWNQDNSEPGVEPPGFVLF